MSSHKEFGIASRRIVTPDGIREGVVLVKDGVISGIVSSQEVPAGIAIHDAGNSVVMPGLVDSHVHINEPGRTEWEGFETATRAAAAGGITTVADMPLNSNPVTTTLPAFEKKLDAANGKLWVDCAFFGGVVPGNTGSLESMIEAGVVGFKCFLIHSGIDDFPNATEADLRQAMPVLARHNVPLLVHAELELEHDHGRENPVWEDPQSYQSFVDSRPRRWENDAIKLMIDLCGQFKCPVHIVHLSSSEALGEIKQARQQGKPFTVETCPHYLYFAAEEIPDGDPRFKCAPPIRERENREKLWQGLKDGTIEIVVSDHSPCVPDLKFLPEGDLKKAWGGISSLQFRLPVTWTQAGNRGFSLEDITQWLCRKPAQFLGLERTKGAIAVGFDADFVIWDPEAKLSFAGGDIHHRHKVTPYEGEQLRGKVEATYLRGEKIYEGGKFKGAATGRHLLRKPVESR